MNALEVLRWMFFDNRVHALPTRRCGSSEIVRRDGAQIHPVHEVSRRPRPTTPSASSTLSACSTGIVGSQP